MGKTGSIQWVKIKNRKGKVRLIEHNRATHKRPGPAQRYSSSGTKRRRIKRSEKAVVR
ncbi:MAG: DUF5350 domain-containing protein [Methanosarcinales archaeon]|nr:DUF5350 domain-containing protein [Methanosarcinales archaeon]